MVDQDPFLPDGYEPPQMGGQYLNPSKLPQGETRLRILAPPIIGQQGWITAGGKDRPACFALDVVPDESVRDVRHMWWMPVWNYSSGSIQLAQVGQGTIQNPIKDYSRNADWGSPLGYDITIKRAGAGLDTEYSVMPSPHKPLAPEIARAWADLLAGGFDAQRVLVGGDPFGAPTVEDREAAAAAFDDPGVADPIKAARGRFFVLLDQAIKLSAFNPSIKANTAAGKEERRRMLKSLMGREIDPGTMSADTWGVAADRMAAVVKASTPPAQPAADDDIPF